MTKSQTHQYPVALCALMIAFGIATKTQAAPLAGTEWRPVEIAGAEPATGAELSLSFGDDGRLSGQGGCNSFFATYEIDGDGIEIGPLGTTMMACDDPVMDMEAGFLKALTASRRFDTSRGALTLSSADGTAVLRLIGNDIPELRELAGSEWRPVSIGGTEIPADTRAFIQFRSSGALAGNGGCNQFTGEFTVNDGGIEIGPLATTRMACPGPAMDLETGLLNALAQARRFEASHLVLTLHSDEGNILARLARTDAD